jgi:hypothetical protein
VVVGCLGGFVCVHACAVVCACWCACVWMPAFVRVHGHVYACVCTNFVFENIHLDDHAIPWRQVGFGGGVEAFHAMEWTISVRRTNKGAEM